MIYLDERLCIATNSELISSDNNILDKSRLLSALGNQYQPYGYDEQRIASTYKSLIINHPFVNGNKRTALLSLLWLCEMNYKIIKLNEDELIDLTLSIADAGGSKISVDDIVDKLFDNNYKL